MRKILHLVTYLFLKFKVVLQIVVVGCMMIYGLPDVWPYFGVYTFPVISPWLIPIMQVKRETEINQIIFEEVILLSRLLFWLLSMPQFCWALSALSGSNILAISSNSSTLMRITSSKMIFLYFMMKWVGTIWIQAF